MDGSEINYVKSKDYWSNIPASLNGMLGGFSSLTTLDVNDSNVFLKKLFKIENGPSKNRALDCGAGIGRITEQLLSKHFECIDLLEQDEKFLNEAKLKLDGTNAKNFYCVSLQDFSPDNDIKYDVIWIQWVLGYVTDNDLVEFLKKCCKSLNKNGLIVVKENISSNEEGEIDTEDSSVTRSFGCFCYIFQKANLMCVARRTQRNFPTGLYKVEMLALRPVDNLKQI
ncbi:N-terminal Xaa-Pro-Lys N-methyltransferase 1 [Adelges cooleyi]|uniref:N-terminal Xaa-Pro-Lys N-methyltransferase 1 n=1 Tax=Adelges cooleyi TaxID=133065 RepID=UPI0021807825|nr:N-terminal Xaa-Pro-Lys N-methyltransferase 1 [Adelges cooleyi]